jgi:hypothetical protein
MLVILLLSISIGLFGENQTGEKIKKNSVEFSPSKILLDHSLAIGYERRIDQKTNFYSYLEIAASRHSVLPFFAAIQDLGVKYEIREDSDQDLYPRFHFSPFGSFKYVEVKTLESHRRHSFVAYGGGVLMGVSLVLKQFSIDFSYGVRSILNRSYFNNVASYKDTIDITQDDHSFARLDVCVKF